MPYHISWYRDNIMLIELEGDVVLEDLQAMSQEGIKLVADAPKRVHAIVDTSKMNSTPLSLRHTMGSVKQERHPNQGFTIMVMPETNAITGFVSSTIMQMLGLEYRLVRSLDEAEKIIQRINH